MSHTPEYPMEENPSGQSSREQYRSGQYPSGQRTTGFQMGEEHQRAITDLMNCSSIIQETLMYCLQQGGRHADARHISLLMDTAEFCKTGTSVLFHSSPVSQRVVGVIAEVCQECATSCEQFGDDSQMRACYDACLRAANSCRRIFGTSTGSSF